MTDRAGHITAVHAEYLPETRSGSPGQNSVKAAIHWLPAVTLWEAAALAK